MSRDAAWISMGFYDGRLKTIIKELCGEEGTSQDFTTTEGDTSNTRLVRTPRGRKYKAIKTEKQGWLVFREGK